MAWPKFELFPDRKAKRDEIVSSVSNPPTPAGWSEPRPLTDAEKEWLLAEIKAGRLHLS